MPYKSLQHFITKLEKEGELVRIKEPVSTKLEITEIVDRISKQSDGGKALLFENTGTAFPLLINSMGSEKRICMALGVEYLDQVGDEIRALLRKASGASSFLNKLALLPTLKEFAGLLPKTKNGRGACQEVVMDEPDLFKLPILTCWPADGGPFITLPAVHTTDPKTGLRNVGMYRMQVLEKDLTGMHWHKHKTGANHFAKYKKLGQHMPVAVTLGGDPSYIYAATAPMPENMDEYLLAGFLRKKRVEMVKCLTQDLEVPADADFVIEGYVDPTEDFIWEGPFGDHTGFYSLADWYPKFHVTCITHRKNAVYPATIVGIPPQEDAWIGLATERIFLTPIQLTMAPELTDMHLPPAGVAHNIALLSIEKSYEGQAEKVMNSLWGAGQMMFNKVMAVYDQGMKLTDYKSLAKLINNFNPKTDLTFTKGPMDVLDHSSGKFAFGSKLGFNFTRNETPAAFIKLPNINAEELLQNLKVESINIDLLKDEIPIIIVGLQKNSPKSISKLIENIGQANELNGIKMIVVVDAETNLNDYYSVAWMVSGNIDPERDCHVIATNNHILLVDGTRKTGKTDKFDRDWPNLVVSDNTTIKKIDALWIKLGLGEHIESPSIKYKLFNKNNDAIFAKGEPKK